jgi:hypothetical protein
MVSFNVIIISGIIILLALIYTKLIFRKSDPEDIDVKREFKERWHSSKANFIEFKKFQYNRAFSLVAEITPFMIFALTLGLVGLKDIIIPIVGLTIYCSAIVAVMIIFLRMIIQLGASNKKATDNLKILYELKE